MRCGLTVFECLGVSVGPPCYRRYRGGRVCALVHVRAKSLYATEVEPAKT